MRGSKRHLFEIQVNSVELTPSTERSRWGRGTFLSSPTRLTCCAISFRLWIWRGLFAQIPAAEGGEPGLAYLGLSWL